MVLFNSRAKKFMSKLGTKESGLFKTAIQLYENKQYKRGLKTCDQILKKYPEHGETLALKGLFLLFTENRDEGFETCKRGLKMSIQSHISWHILGLMHRQDKNYEEAIKCYKNALKIDKDNFQILRDLALLQLQCRQLEGAIDTRRKIIFSRPSSPFNWISLVIAYHISGNLQQALDTLNIYLEVFAKIHDPSENHKYYKVSIMLELGLFEETIEYILASFTDKTSRRYYEALAEAYYFSKKYPICEELLWKLLNINPDCREYLSRLLSVHVDQGKDIGSFYDKIKEASLLAAIELLPLVNFEVFKSKLPSTFSEIMNRESPAAFQLFKESLKIETRKDLIWECLQTMDKTKVSVISFKVNFLSYTKENDLALKEIDYAIQNHPECIDLIMLKAHVLKKLQMTSLSVAEISNSQDKFSNDKFCVSKIAKYLIRYGSISDAQKLLGKFIQKPTPAERMGDLHEMQAVWYLIEMGDRLLKDGKFISAACFYRKIDLIYSEIIDDQLDFHGYSLRRMSFEEYVKFLRFLDQQLKRSDYFKKALVGLSNCLLSIAAETDLSSLFSSLNVSDLSPAFDDDIEPHMNYFKSLISNPKALDETLRHVFTQLISNHPEDSDALSAGLKLSLHLKCFLSSQKIVIKLVEAGVVVSNEIVDKINDNRCESWNEIPILM